MGTKEFHNSLVEVANKVKRKPDMSEGGISSVFVDSGFFKDLGYKDIGIDIKSQERLRGPGKIPDFECLDDFEQSIFVLELKKPTNESIRPLESYLDDQLKDRYVIPKRSRYGILSNGIKFYLYKREQNRLIEALKVEDLSVISESDAQAIYNALKKPSYEYTDLSQILEELRQIDPKPLSEEENREAFYQIFRLKQEESGLPTKFTRLVLSLMNLFDELRENGEKSEFLEGSYRFWKQSYAHKPSKVPESWSRIKKIGKKPSEETLYKFMFCLETAHNIVSKLILAKVCEDAEFKNVSSLKKLEAYMNLKFGEGRVNLIAYPFAIKETFDSLRSYLVSSIFEDDIFDWWQDCEIRVGKEVHEWRSRPNYAVEQFGEALARIFFALRSFEFSEVQEDILGELYQHYFDPETRKALGEFYTPIEVVDYILDAVDYKGQKILQQRLLDPACGSGAFVVEALKRYLRALDKQIEKKGNPEVLPASLRDLCERPKIIGFDINPFARLMAQMRFMMEIIPYYKKAQEIDPNFVLTTIPIFRTDSLEVETKTGRFQKQLGEFAGDIKFHMRLPVISKEAREEKDQFLPISFNIPAWERVRDILKNKDNYFLLLKHSFEVIKDHAQKEKWEVDREALKKKYEERFADAETLAGIMLEYVDPILRQIKVLRQEYSDGRLIKTIEDLVLAGVLKNYFLYDYVVGNPPYVRNDLIPKEQKTIYERHYESPFKGYDLYFLFIEAGLKWLLQDGLLGYICSNQFMTRTYGKNLRSYILVNSGIHQIIDFTDSGVFKDATNYPTILIFGKENVEKFTCVKVFKPKAQILNDIKIHLSDSKYSEPSYKIFQIDQKKLTEDIWSLAPEDEERVLKRVFGNSNCTIGEKCKVVSGTRIGKDNLFIGTIEKLGENKVKFLPQEYKKQPSFFDVDKELLKPILKGRDVRRWRISWQEFYMIFPHVEKDSKLEIIPEPVLKEKYVATYNYFQKHKDILEKRIWFDKNPTQLHGAYYAIMYSDSPSTYNNSRILTPALTNKTNFALNSKGYFFVGGTAGILGIIPTKVQEHYLLGILNSNVLDFYIRNTTPVKAGGYNQYSAKQIERLPIRLPQNEAEQKLADEITKRVEKILSLAKKEQRIENFPEPYFDELLDEIDEWEEVRWRSVRNYKEVRIKVETDLDGDRTLVFGKDDELAEPAIDSEAKLQYVIKALQSKKVKKGGVVVVRLPKSDAVVNKILERHEEDTRALQETPISKMEEEINERVYRLYGLDEGDIKVIKEFLEKF